jgi:hypothetical protein
MLTTSAPFVPSTITWSAAASPRPLPAGLLSSTLTLLTSVPLRSWTVTRSAAPRALTSTSSTPSVSIVMLPMLRVKRSLGPLAESSNVWFFVAPFRVI